MGCGFTSGGGSVITVDSRKSVAGIPTFIVGSHHYQNPILHFSTDVGRCTCSTTYVRTAEFDTAASGQLSCCHNDTVVRAMAEYPIEVQTYL